PALAAEPQALGLGVEPSPPHVAKLVGCDSPLARVGGGAEIGRQIARLASELTLAPEADGRLVAEGRVYLDGGARDHLADLLSREPRRLALSNSRRTQAGRREEWPEHWDSPENNTAGSAP